EFFSEMFANSTGFPFSSVTFPNKVALLLCANTLAVLKIRRNWNKKDLIDLMPAKIIFLL
ncbi:MAG: hypothetical protein Q8K69_13585, partial [Bacteroidota bacterium]|nr:hypothetical protein [Bacteroidota bacterium]